MDIISGSSPVLLWIGSPHCFSFWFSSLGSPLLVLLSWSPLLVLPSSSPCWFFSLVLLLVLLSWFSSGSPPAAPTCRPSRCESWIFRAASLALSHLDPSRPPWTMVSLYPLLRPLVVGLDPLTHPARVGGPAQSGVQLSSTTTSWRVDSSSYKVRLDPLSASCSHSG